MFYISSLSGEAGGVIDYTLVDTALFNYAAAYSTVLLYKTTQNTKHNASAQRVDIKQHKIQRVDPASKSALT